MNRSTSSSFTCTHCGARHAEEAWQALTLAQRIEPGEIRRLLLDWPDDWCIEVRGCGACAGLIAAKCDFSANGSSLG